MIAKLRAFGMLEGILEMPGHFREQLFLPFFQRPQVFEMITEIPLDRRASEMARFRFVEQLDEDTALYEFDGME